MNITSHYGHRLRVGDRVHVASALGIPMVDRDTRRPSVWTVAELCERPDCPRPVRLAETRPGGVQPDFEWYPPQERVWFVARHLYPAAKVLGDPDQPWARLTARYAPVGNELWTRRAVWNAGDTTAYLFSGSAAKAEEPCYRELHALELFYLWGRVVTITYGGGE